MVLAEIPLWVVHDSGVLGTGGSQSIQSSSSSLLLLSSTSSLGGQQKQQQNRRKAEETLDSLLLSSTTTTDTAGGDDNNNNNHNNDDNNTYRNKKKKKKCAVYSIDIHPDGTKFATAGGDGTVRIWNTGALFQNANTSTTNTNTNGSNRTQTTQTTTPKMKMKTARYDTDKDGAYVSTDYSSSSSSGSSIGSRSQNDDTNHNRYNNDNSGSDDNDEGATTTLTTNERNGSNGINRTAMKVTKKERHSQQKENSLPPPPPPKLLCTLSAHTGSSVLIVRFSNNGRYLASAADDACVCIYAPSSPSLAATTTTATGTTTTTTAAPTDDIGLNSVVPLPNMEQWYRIRLCRGHGLDVVDLAWSPDDAYLVSCSLDSETPIIVWDVRDLDSGVIAGGTSTSSSSSSSTKSMIQRPHKILGVNVHTSTVKGVAFDPAGSYLASSGDDPAVCIWRTADEFDDWELEHRIDASDGIFRTWNSSSSSTTKTTVTDGSTSVQRNSNSNIGELSNQSLFRRISWSTDGSFVCSTNSVVKNKHVLSTITRSEWKTGENSANLVGHKQPVVACRHSSYLLSRKDTTATKIDKSTEGNGGVVDDDDDDDDPTTNTTDEPDYATLLAMGDRQGFVTVWSTKKTRPIFKLQCSESRCTVTDLSWGKCCSDGDLFLLISLLDGQIVALKFSVPMELGRVLSLQEKATVFELRYGIDILEGGAGSHLKRLLAGSTGNSHNNKLYENVLQMSLEEERQQNKYHTREMNVEPMDTNTDKTHDDSMLDRRQPNLAQGMQQSSIKNLQEESFSKSGKKRVRPVLITQVNDSIEKRPKIASTKDSAITPKDSLQEALEVAERAEALVASASPSAVMNKGKATIVQDKDDDFDTVSPTANRSVPMPSGQTRSNSGYNSIQSSVAIPHSTDRVYVADLPIVSNSSIALATGDDKVPSILVVEARNAMKVPIGSRGLAIPCIDVSVVRNGRVTWRDQIVGATCTAIAASKYFVAIGMVDGSFQMYGTSHETGWVCGNAFRSHPPLIVLGGHPIVTLRLRESNETRDEHDSRKTDKYHLEALIVGGDASFAVYTFLPATRLLYKGTLMSPMVHMASSSSSSSSTDHHRLPKLSRVYITHTGKLVLILSMQPRNTGNNNVLTSTQSSRTSADFGGAGGSIQAYVYDKISEMWMRISDSRFLLSDFYSTLPNLEGKLSNKVGILAELDNSILFGSIQSSLKKQTAGGSNRRSPDQHHRAVGDGGRGLLIYSNQATNGDDDSGNYISTRSHCEDRMSCALALGSSVEFKEWFTLYVETLVRAGHGTQLRILVNMLLGTIDSDDNHDSNLALLPEANATSTISIEGCWWLGNAPSVLGLDRKELIKSVVIPEMSRNRALQRLTNEIAMDIGCL